MKERTEIEKVFLLSISVLFAVVVSFGLPRNAFLLSFYIIPIILAANYYGLAGGLGCAGGSTVLAIFLTRASGMTLDDTQIIAQVILYFLVGSFGGFMQRENVRIQKALHLSSITDELTGLYNYQHFRKRLDEEVKRAKRYAHPLAIVMCDVDHFKRYNDVFGHPNGNFVLNKIAGIIKGSIRDSDIAFRYGGDEFAVILAETGAKASEVAERIVSGVSASFDLEKMEDEVRPGLTAGVAFTDFKKPSSASELISIADQALYQAKKSSKRVVVISQEAEMSS